MIDIEGFLNIYEHVDNLQLFVLQRIIYVQSVKKHAIIGIWPYMYLRPQTLKVSCHKNVIICSLQF